MGNLAEILQTRRPNYLFHGLILDNSLTMISAPPYTGKSLIVCAMILSLDFALPLFGKLTPTSPRRVLAFLQDAPEWDYAEQLRKLLRGYKLTPEQVDLSETSFEFETSEGMPHRINDPETISKISDFKPDVVFFDAFWTTHTKNEIDKREMMEVMQVYKALRASGMSIIFTHHDKKPSRDSAGSPLVYRSSGSHVISAACDNQLFLSRRAEKIIVQAGKARGGSAEQHTIAIANVDHADGDAIQLRMMDENETRAGRLCMFICETTRTRAEVIAYLRSIEPRLQTGTAERAVDKILAQLASQGRIERAEHGKWCAVGSAKKGGENA